MEKIQIIKSYCKQLNLSAVCHSVESFFEEALTRQKSYTDLVLSLLELEIKNRQEKNFCRRLKMAALPIPHDLGSYDYSYNNGLSKVQLEQLKEMEWLEQVYNIILMGPCGVGKTFLAAGLCYLAIQKGYKALFRTMESIIDILRLKDTVKTQNAEYKRLLKADLIVIDDIMMLPMNRELAMKFFNFVNTLFDKTSLIITSNKAPSQWVEILEDEVITTAILDRMLFRCQVINLKAEKSYRLKNRKTIFYSIKIN